MMRVLAIALVFGVACFWCPRTRADESQPRQAKKLFREGVARFKSGEYEEAVTAFRQANDLQPSWKISFNIGQCEAALRNYGLAFEAFESYLLRGGDEISQERQQEVLQEIERLRALSGVLEVAGPEGATVSVDGRERGVLPLPGALRVAGGLHDVIVMRDGEPLLERKIKFTSGATVTLDVGPEEDASAEAPETASPAADVSPVSAEEPPAEEDDGPESSLVLWGWITAGAGAALAVAGGVTGGMALAANDQLERDCPDGCYEPDHGELDRRDNLALTTDILIGVGSAALVAGAVMLIVGYRGEEQAEAVAVYPVFGDQNAGLRLNVRF